MECLYDFRRPVGRKYVIELKGSRPAVGPKTQRRRRVRIGFALPRSTDRFPLNWNVRDGRVVVSLLRTGLFVWRLATETRQNGTRAETL